ncbi:unnamed protein product [Leptosia nina]|uniref:Growth-blocking peptide, long form n=1 Tax=Leptosia nina TaxID=320188 RepID=A0AAV1JTF6_9NEOP
MKSVFVLSIVILLSSTCEGGLLKDVVVTIHEKAHNIREDIKNVLHHKDENTPQNSISNKDHKPSTTEKVETDKTIAVNTPSAITFPDDIPTKEVAVKTEQLITSTVSSVSSSTIASNSTTKENQDGRDNFRAANCATGFKKTADGRCKPTF